MPTRQASHYLLTDSIVTEIQWLFHPGKVNIVAFPLSELLLRGLIFLERRLQLLVLLRELRLLSGPGLRKLHFTSAMIIGLSHICDGIVLGSINCGFWRLPLAP